MEFTDSECSDDLTRFIPAIIEVHRSGKVLRVRTLMVLTPQIGEELGSVFMSASLGIFIISHHSRIISNLCGVEKARRSLLTLAGSAEGSGSSQFCPGRYSNLEISRFSRWLLVLVGTEVLF